MKIKISITTKPTINNCLWYHWQYHLHHHQLQESEWPSAKNSLSIHASTIAFFAPPCWEYHRHHHHTSFKVDPYHHRVSSSPSSSSTSASSQEAIVTSVVCQPVIWNTSYHSFIKVRNTFHVFETHSICLKHIPCVWNIFHVFETHSMCLKHIPCVWNTFQLMFEGKICLVGSECFSRRRNAGFCTTLADSRVQ